MTNSRTLGGEMLNLKKFYNNKTIVITGHTGFKGGWLASWLKIMGANVVGVAFDPPTTPSLFEQIELSETLIDLRFDINETEHLLATFHKYKPDFLFHLAAQPLVKSAYERPQETMQSNAMGTVSILEVLRRYSSKISVVFITSDKVYDNQEWVCGYRESDKLGGKDPYSASKAMAELAISTYCNSYFLDSPLLKVGIGRAGNVIGGGDWAENRIVPDVIKAWDNREFCEIRNPASTRPWQHVLEPLSGYLTLGVLLERKMLRNGEAFNFGPPANQDKSVKELVEKMSQHWPDKDVGINSPNVQEASEAGLLKLNCDKAKQLLNWEPTLGFEETVKMTVDWYRKFSMKDRSSMKEFTINQINKYIELGKLRKKTWSY